VVVLLKLPVSLLAELYNDKSVKLLVMYLQMMYTTCVLTTIICGKVSRKNKNQIGAAIEDLETPQRICPFKVEIY
jgi:hypothetical protein